MNCVRCGEDIPEDGVCCSNCGLNLKVVPVGTPTSPGAAPMPGPPAPTPTAAPLPGPPASPPGQYISPGDAHAVGLYTAPDEVPAPGAYPPDRALRVSLGRSLRRKRSMSTTTGWIFIACIAAVVILGMFAGMYFIAMSLMVQSGPKKTVLDYFDAMSAGDMDTVKTLFTPEAMPSDETLSAYSGLISMSAAKYEDIKLKTLNQTKTDAVVQVVDFTVRASVNGRSVKYNLSELFKSTKITVKLKNVNGAWLIDQKGFPASFSAPPSSGF